MQYAKSKLFCLGSHFREVNSSLPHAAMTIGHVSRGFATAIVLHDSSSINVNRDYNLLLGTQTMSFGSIHCHKSRVHTVKSQYINNGCPAISQAEPWKLHYT